MRERVMIAIAIATAIIGSWVVFGPLRPNPLLHARPTAHVAAQGR